MRKIITGLVLGTCVGLSSITPAHAIDPDLQKAIDYYDQVKRTYGCYPDGRTCPPAWALQPTAQEQIRELKEELRRADDELIDDLGR